MIYINQAYAKLAYKSFHSTGTFMNTQTLILAILNFGDASGYEIKKESSEGVFSYFVDISYGSIYPTLAKLEADGMVIGRSESQSGKPDKKVFSITEKGREEFIKTLASPPAIDKFKSEFLLVAMSAGQTTPDVITKAIDKRIIEMEQLLELITSLRSDCDHPATQWITSYGLHVKGADLEFLRNNRESLIAMAGQDTKLDEAAE